MISDKLIVLGLFHRFFFLLLVLLLPTQLGLHFWPLWSTVFGIRVDYLAPTIYLTDLLVVGILITWLGEIWIKNFKFKVKNSFVLFCLLFIYLFIVSIFVAQDSGAAIYKLIKIIEFVLLGTYIYKTKLPFSLIQIPLIVVIIYSSLIGWMQFILQHTLGGTFWWLGERTLASSTPGIALVEIWGKDFLRPYSIFPHPNVLAGFLLVSSIIVWSKQFHFWINAFFLFVGSTIFITFSQSAWIASLFVIPFLIFRTLQTFLKKFTATLLVFIIIISFAVPFLPSVDVGKEDIMQRLELAKTAKNMIVQFPLTGVGLNNFIVKLPQYSPLPAVAWWLQPVHNIVLLTLAETGIVGFAAVTWFFFLLIKHMSRMKWRFYLILIVIMITGFFDHYWFTLQQTQLLLTLSVALAALKSNET